MFARSVLILAAAVVVSTAHVDLQEVHDAAFDELNESQYAGYVQLDEAAEGEQVGQANVLPDSGVSNYTLPDWVIDLLPKMSGWDSVSTIWESAPICKGLTSCTRCKQWGCNMCQVNSFRWILPYIDKLVPENIANLLTDEEIETGMLCGIGARPCSAFIDWWDNKVPTLAKKFLTQITEMPVLNPCGDPWWHFGNGAAGLYTDYAALTAVTVMAVMAVFMV